MKPVSSKLASMREVLREPVLVAWVLFILLIPFYVGESGLPQPGNGLLVVIVPLAISKWNGKMQTGVVRILRPLIWFTLWACVVNYGWALINDKWQLSAYALFPIYYIFNAILFVTALVIYQQHGDKFLRATTYAVVVIVLFQVVASFFYQSVWYRGQLFFNNPNQLGYYALLAGCMIALLQKPANMSRLAASIGLTGCAYLAVLSASRAAAAGIGILFVLLMFSNPRLIILGVFSAVILLGVGGPISNAIDYAEERVASEQSQGFVEERAYDRLWLHKEHLILGAGEGDVGRFTDDPHAREIHSSAATVVFSYGIIGTILFLAFAFRVAGGASIRMIAMLIPTFAYTMAHQGLRFSMLWVLLAIFVAVKLRAIAVARAGAAAAATKGSILDLPISVTS